MQRERVGGAIPTTPQGCAERHAEAAAARARAGGSLPPLGSLPDPDLMRRVQGGDEDAFRALYDRFESPALGLAHRIVRSTPLAEEVVQDAFVSIWRRSGQYRAERGSVRSWILQIVHNHAVDGLRSQLRHDRRRSGLDACEVRQPAPQLTDLEAARREDRRALRRVLCSLPDEQRQVLELAYFADLSQQQIASALHTPLGTIKGRARLGLARMRAQLEGPFAGAVAT